MDSPEQALILCHTFFDRAFIIRAENFSKEEYKKWHNARFIANFIIEKYAEEPERRFAFTTKTCFDKFFTTLTKNVPKHPEIYQNVTLLQDMLAIDASQAINNLNDNEGIIALADSVYSLGQFEPILVTDMVQKKREVAETFYKAANRSNLLRIHSLEDTVALLKDRYAGLSQHVLGRMKEPGL